MNEEKKLTYSQWCRIRRKEIKYDLGLAAMVVLPPVLMVFHYFAYGY